jgi:hypothetical protein
MYPYPVRQKKKKKKEKKRSWYLCLTHICWKSFKKTLCPTTSHAHAILWKVSLCSRWNINTFYYGRTIWGTGPNKRQGRLVQWKRNYLKVSQTTWKNPHNWDMVMWNHGPQNHWISKTQNIKETILIRNPHEVYLMHHIYLCTTYLAVQFWWNIPCQLTK